MGLLHFENILKVFINRYGMNGLNKRKMGFKKKKNLPKKFGCTPSTIF
jgi:hypothetical protein